MVVNFRLVEQKDTPYDVLKQAYLDGLRGDAFRKKFGLGTSQYSRLLRDFREDGIEVPKQGRTPVNKETRWYACEGYGEYRYYVVKRVVNKKKYTFGRFKTEAEAQRCVRDCIANNWYGILDDYGD